MHFPITGLNNMVIPRAGVFMTSSFMTSGFPYTLACVHQTLPHKKIGDTSLSHNFLRGGDRYIY